MCDICNGMTIEEARERTLRNIAKFGWECRFVEGDLDDTAFGYTIGLTEEHHPELLLTGRTMAETHAMLSLLVHRILHHRHTLVPGMEIPLRPRKVVLARMLKPENVLLDAHALYKGRLRGLQVVWADGEGCFPWEQQVPDVLTQPLHAATPLLWRGTG